MVHLFLIYKIKYDAHISSYMGVGKDYENPQISPYLRPCIQILIYIYHSVYYIKTMQLYANTLLNFNILLFYYFYSNNYYYSILNI
jgi:hypothetical protein